MHDRHDDSWEVEAGVVRPYVLTQGRAHGCDRLAVEAVVEATPLGRDTACNLRPEARRILELCRRPRSVAEVAAHLGTPLAVTRVLVADLTDVWLLRVHEPADDVVADIDLLERMIARVRAIPV